MKHPEMKGRNGKWNTGHPDILAAWMHFISLSSFTVLGKKIQLLLCLIIHINSVQIGNVPSDICKVSQQISDMSHNFLHHCFASRHRHVILLWPYPDQPVFKRQVPSSASFLPHQILLGLSQTRGCWWPLPQTMESVKRWEINKTQTLRVSICHSSDYDSFRVWPRKKWDSELHDDNTHDSILHITGWWWWNTGYQSKTYLEL